MPPRPMGHCIAGTVKMIIESVRIILSLPPLASDSKSRK